MMQPTKEQEVYMMTHPAEWPMGHLLPLVNWMERQRGKQPPTAFMLAENRPVIYVGNVFGFALQDEVTFRNALVEAALPFSSYEAIYDAGWRVD